MRYVAWIFNKMWGYDYPLRTTEFTADSFTEASAKVYEADKFADVVALIWLDADTDVDFYALPKAAAAAIDELSDQQGLTETQVLVQALRRYYSVVNPLKLPPGGCMGGDD